MVSIFQGKGISWIIEAFWVGFGLITSVLALLAGTRFLTKLLSTEEYGKLALAISLATLAVQIFGDPIGKTAVRFYTHWRDAGKFYGFMQNLGKSLTYALAVIVLFCMGVLISGHFWAVSPGFCFVIVTGIFTILLILHRVAFGLEDAARKRRFRGIIQGIFEALRFMFAIGFVILWATPDAKTVLMGFAVAGTLVVIAHGIFLYRLFSTAQMENTADQKMIAEIDTVSMQAFQFPLVFSNACIWLVMMAERWILNHSGLSGDVGGYAAVYQLAFIPMLFISNFMVLLIEPILYQTAHLDRAGVTPVQVLRMNRYAGVGILCVTLVLFLVLLFCYPTVGSFFLGIEFRSYSWIFPWLLLSGGCFAAAQQLLLILNCEMRTGLLAILWGVVAAIAVIAYIIGANYWQLKGVIAAIVFVNALLLVFSYLFSNRLFRKSNLGQ